MTPSKKIITVVLLGGALFLIHCGGQPLKEEKQAAKDQGTQAVTSQDAEGNEIDNGATPPATALGNSQGASGAATGPSINDVNKSLYQRFADARKRRDITTANQVGGEILSRNPNDTRILNSLAALAIEQGKYDLARLYTDKTLVKDPNNGAAYNNLGVVELKTDNLRLALIQFKKATAFDPKNKAAHANLGTIYLKYRNYTNAAEELKDAVENGDQSPETLSNYAFAQTGEGDYGGAAKSYERALAKDSNNISILVNYSVLMVERLHKYKDAIKVLNKIRFIAREPAILDKVEILLKKAEKPGSEKGVSE
jgi:tetratricopeptide (TPR) repeat protein